MSKNETPDSDETNSDETNSMDALFAKLRETKIEPSPFLKTRVLARANEGQGLQKNLLFWKVLSLGSLTSLALALVVTFNMYKKTQKSQADGIAEQAYVIHINFNDADKTSVARAQIELPSDVHFVSKNQDMRGQRSLTLPVAVKTLGKGKLPFVVSADFPGEKEIKVRLLDENDQVVREQIMKLKFAKADAAATIE
jgi:hypothetical protein